MSFSSEKRPALLAERPELAKNVTEQGKVLGGMWRELSEEQKKPYKDAAAADALREQAEMTAYHNQMAHYQVSQGQPEESQGQAGDSPGAGSNDGASPTQPPGDAAPAAAASSQPYPQKMDLGEPAEPPPNRPPGQPVANRGPPTNIRRFACTACLGAPSNHICGLGLPYRPRPNPAEEESLKLSLEVASWTVEEGAVLRRLVFEQGEGQWALKARQLGTGRTGLAVLQHWVYTKAKKLAMPPVLLGEQQDRAMADVLRRRAARAKKEQEEPRPFVTESYEPPNPVTAGSDKGEMATQWGCYSSVEELESLLQYLDPRGPRESALLIRIRRILPAFFY